MRIRVQSILALLIIGGFVTAAIAAPFLSPSAELDKPDPYKVVGKTYDKEPHPPSPDAWLGTTPGQFDIFHLLMWGTRNAFSFGLSVALLTAILGTLIGIVSGYAGGVINQLAMRVTDAFLTFPMIAAIVFTGLIAASIGRELGLVFFLSSEGQWTQTSALGDTRGVAGSMVGLLFSLFSRLDPTIIALVLFSWMPYARIMNDLVVRLKQTEFIEAARAVGVRHRRIILKHLLPNVISPAVVLAARDVGAMVVLQATFAYVGIGSASPWSTILTISKDWIIGPGGSLIHYWWIFLPATLAFILFGIGWNLFGDELNHWLNPRSR